jgi:mannosyltransferase OCH1-like enzyme
VPVTKDHFQKGNPTKQANRTSMIPLDIWQTYRTRDIPRDAEKCRQTWVHQKKSKYHFMDDHDIEQFMRSHFDDPPYLTFVNFPLGVMRADMWRYCVLYVHGGIYADIDSKLLKPVTDWNINPSDQIIISLENDLHFCQWTIASVPRHPILKRVIEMIVQEAQNGIDTSDEHFVHKHTGPGIWTRAIHQTLGINEAQKAIDTWNIYNDPQKRSIFKKLGVRLESKTFFNGENVKNMYGSTQFKDGYHSWIEERDEIIKKNVKT